ncbi:MAG: hypothetical protein KJ622_11260 [Alphaproteobacteria bacterium]|nr:hypothetical protein [Alphaproteobacteria bacterium]
MRFNVSRAFNVILDPDVLLYRRAVTLYELQVAILSCSGLASTTQKKSGGFVIKADGRLLRSARVLATLQLLQHDADRHDKDGVRNEFKLIALIAKRDSLELISDVVFGRIGLERVRYARRPRDLSLELQQLNIEADCVVALADFSLGFTPLASRPRKKGGITTALDTIYLDRELNPEPFYLLERGKDSARNYARRLQPVSALLWIFDQFRGFLPPPQVHTKPFARRLLSLARRQVRLGRIAASYECVAGQLRQRGYKCPPLELNRRVEPQTIDFEPLPEQLRSLI